jgi:hypothetical protein
VKKRLGWVDVGAAESAAIVEAITQIVEARLNDKRNTAS